MEGINVYSLLVTFLSTIVGVVLGGLVPYW